jgi:hypothetical protein
LTVGTWASWDEAQAWVQRQGVRSVADWKARCQQEGWRPAHIPSNPDRVYGADFVAGGGWGGFFGTNREAAPHRQYRSLPRAAAWVQTQGITSAAEWRIQAAQPDWLPPDIPTNPDKVYADFQTLGGWGAFLGTGRIAHQDRLFRPLAEAALWAQAQGLTRRVQWHTRCQEPGWRPEDIPANPAAVYGASFTEAGGWRAFLTRAEPATEPATPRRRRAP